MKNYLRLLVSLILLSVVFGSEVTFQSSIHLSPKAKEIAQRAEWMFAPDHFVGIDAAYDIGNDFYTHIQVERQGGIGDWFVGGYYLGSTTKSREGRLGFYFPFGNMRSMVGMQLVDNQFYPLVGLDYSQREWQARFQIGSQVELGLSYTWGAAEKALADVFHILTPADGMKTNLTDIQVRGYYLDKGTILLEGKPLSLRADGLFSEKVLLPTWGPKTIHFKIQGEVVRDYETSLTVIRTAPYWDVPESRQLKWASILDKLGKEPRNLFFPTENVSRTELFTAVGKLLDQDLIKGGKSPFKSGPTISRKNAYQLLNRYVPVQRALTLKESPDDNLSRGEMMDLLAQWYPLVTSIEGGDTPNPKLEIPLNEQTAKVLGPIAVIRKILSVEKAPPMREDPAMTAITLLTPTKLSRVRSSTFTVKGKGPAGLSVRVGTHVTTIPKSGQFKVDLSLNPGLNTIGVAVPSKDKQIINVVYQKQYQDLPPKDMFTPFYEKMGTLGYFVTDKRFEPSKVLTKKEFYQSLIKAGYGQTEDLETLGPLDQRMSYRQAVDVMQKIAGRPLSKDTAAAGDLTRRMFALLLYELPKVKSDIQKKFPDAQ